MNPVVLPRAKHMSCFSGGGAYPIPSAFLERQIQQNRCSRPLVNPRLGGWGLEHCEEAEGCHMASQDILLALRIRHFSCWRSCDHAASLIFRVLVTAFLP